ncbi:hypothetical protein I6F07_28945 [Ensifer sp. IC4062]|nr:hypothetical protein [Ensifer sp. IC4062]
MPNDNRIEHDPLGPVSVPTDRYHGAQTSRALDNFPTSGIPIKSMPNLIRALAHVKMAAAQANCDEGLPPTEKRVAIVLACQEVLAGKHDEEFLVHVFQSGAGTSTNMNMNEVLANRASELLGGVQGEGRLVHPNDGVNRSLSSNDAYAAPIGTGVAATPSYRARALENLSRDNQLSLVGSKDLLEASWDLGLKRAVVTFTRTCVEGVQANAARSEANLKNSTAFTTELVTSIGYDAAAQLVKERLAS